jgi:hypothetical protein
MPIAARAWQPDHLTGPGHGPHDAAAPGFSGLEFLASFFFSARRFLVTVSIDFSGCNSVLNESFSKLFRRPRYSSSFS